MVENKSNKRRRKVKIMERPVWAGGAGVPVIQVGCCRWSGWCHSLRDPAATGRCCKSPSCLLAACRSSLRRLSYTRGTADCRPEQDTQTGRDQYKPGRADRIFIDRAADETLVWRFPPTESLLLWCSYERHRMQLLDFNTFCYNKNRR